MKAGNILKSIKDCLRIIGYLFLFVLIGLLAYNIILFLTEIIYEVSMDIFSFYLLVAITLFCIIMVYYLMKNDKKTIGYLIIGFGLVSVIGCLLIENGIHAMKVEVISTSENSIVVKGHKIYEIKRPPIININSGDYIYVKGSNYVVSPKFGRILTIVGTVMVETCSFYGACLIFNNNVKKGRKYGKKK